jgi:hypothetical protein
MSFLPSLLHAELVRERSGAGRRRVPSERLVRPSLSAAARRRPEDDGGRRETAPAAATSVSG